jgi:hypothetical protein
MFTKYKLQKLKTKQILHQTILKLQNSHSKIHNSAGTSSVKPKDSRNSGGASPPRAASGGAWLYAPPYQTPEKAGVSHSFLPSSRPRRCDLQNTQKRNRQSILVFLYFVFISASLSLFLHFGSAPLYRSVLFPFVSPFLFQVVGCMTKRAAGC